MLRENNVRAGFFERDQYLAVQRHLPPSMQPVVTFAYVTGWRINSEVEATVRKTVASFSFRFLNRPSEKRARVPRSVPRLCAQNE
jgi:hypothetical protein